MPSVLPKVQSAAAAAAAGGGRAVTHRTTNHRRPSRSTAIRRGRRGRSRSTSCRILALIRTSPQQPGWWATPPRISLRRLRCTRRTALCGRSSSRARCQAQPSRHSSPPRRQLRRAHRKSQRRPDRRRPTIRRPPMTLRLRPPRLWQPVLQRRLRRWHRRLRVRCADPPCLPPSLTCRCPPPTTGVDGWSLPACVDRYGRP